MSHILPHYLVIKRTVDYLQPVLTKRLWINLALTVLTLAALYGALTWRTGLSIEAFEAAARRFPVSTVVLATALMAWQVLFMVLRMIALAPSQSRPHWKEISIAVAVGHMMNMFLPARTGEALKAVWLGRTAGLDTGYVARGAGWIVADRAAEIVALLLLLLATGVFRLPGFRQALPFTWGQALGALVVLGGGIGLVSYASTRLRDRFRLWAQKWRDGLSGLRHPRKFPLAVLMALGGWAVEGVALYLLCQAQGFTLSLPELYFVILLLNLAVALPLAVANVGPFEASIAFALGFFNMPPAQGIAVGAAHHLFLLAGVAASGSLALMWKRFSKERSVPPAP